MSAQSAAKIVRRHLADLPPPNQVWSSPLRRCMDLALAYEKRPLIESRLMEANFGRWEELTWDEIHARYSEEMKEWGESWLKKGPAGGESALDVQTRFQDWLLSIDEGIHLAFTHAGVIRAARVVLQEQTGTKRWKNRYLTSPLKSFRLPQSVVHMTMFTLLNHRSLTRSYAYRERGRPPELPLASRADLRSQWSVPNKRPLPEW